MSVPSALLDLDDDSISDNNPNGDLDSDLDNNPNGDLDDNLDMIWTTILIQKTVRIAAWIFYILKTANMIC